MWGTLLTESPSKGQKAWTCSELNQRTSWFRGKFREGSQGATVSSWRNRREQTEWQLARPQRGRSTPCRPGQLTSTPSSLSLGSAPSPQLWLLTSQLDLRSPDLAPGSSANPPPPGQAPSRPLSPRWFSLPSRPHSQPCPSALTMAKVTSWWPTSSVTS